MYIFTVISLALSYSPPCSVQNCETCSVQSPSVCINCLSTHTLSDHGCSPDLSFLKPAIANCQQISPENSCVACSPNYFLLNGRCEPSCSSNCICQLPNICLTSRNLEKHGDHDDNDQCDKGCERCTSDNVCEECFEGFELVEGICADSWCGRKCEDCSEGKCSACSDGFYLSDGRCEECYEGCEKCVGYGECQECRDDYRLDNGTCVSRFCGDRCEECSEGTCLSCAQGFYLQDNKCLECVEGCTNCSNYNKCEKCEQNFNLTNGTCLSNLCSKNCEVCSSGICSLCSERFYLQGQECEECPEGCKSCANSTYCYECEFGNATNGACLENHEEKGSKKSLMIAIICSTGGLVVILSLIYYIRRKRRQRSKQASESIVIADQNTPGFLAINEANSKLNECDGPSGLFNDNSVNADDGKLTPQSFECSTPVVIYNNEEIPVAAEINQEKAQFIRNQCELCNEELQMNVETIILPCNHAFHMKCINKIVQMSGGKTCPTCRFKYY